LKHYIIESTLEAEKKIAKIKSRLWLLQI